MRNTFKLALSGAAVAVAAMIAAPPPAKAQVGISIGFGSGYGYGYDPGFVGVGYSSPSTYYGGYAPVYDVGYYAPPAYRVVRRPASPVVVSYRQPTYYYGQPVYDAPRPVVRTRIVTRAPRYVVRRTRVVRSAPRVVTRQVVTQAPVARRTQVIRRTYY